jgi:hypothetical protein
VEGKSLEPTPSSSRPGGPIDRALSSLRSPWRIVVATCIAVFITSGVTELVAPSAWSVDNDFFLACSTVGPLIGLALFVEISLVMSPIIDEQGSTPANRATVQALVRINASMLVIAETAALFSVSTSARGTFFVAASVIPWLVQLALMVQTVYYRTGVNRVGPKPGESGVSREDG